MRVAVVTTSLNRIVGSTYVAVAFIHALKRLGHTVWLISVDKPDKTRLRQYYGRYYVEPDKTVFDLSPLDILSVLIKRDLFVINSYADGVPYPFDLNYFHTVPLGSVGSSPDPLLSGLSELLASSHSINWCNSKLTQEQLVKFGIHAEVVYPPVLPVRPVSGVERDAIGYFGRIDRNKRIELLLDIAESAPDIPVIIAGKREVPYYDELVKEVKRRGLHNVKLMPDIPHSAKPYVLSKMRVMVHPKEGEPFGLAPLEAAYAGALPLLPCKSGAYEVVSGDLPCFRSAADVPGLALGLYRSYSESLSRRVIERIRKHASFDVFTARLEQVVGRGKEHKTLDL